MKKFYESPELLLAKYEADVSIASLSMEETYEEENAIDKDSWNNMFGGN